MIKETVRSNSIKMSKIQRNYNELNEQYDIKEIIWHRRSKHSNGTNNNLVNLLEKLYILLKKIVQKMNADKSSEERRQSILVEWKELARKIEFIFCIVSFVSNTASPIILFHKYFTRYYENDFSLSQKCACESSFT